MFSISAYRPYYASGIAEAPASPLILSGGPDKKALARQRVAEIKQQIEALRRMLLLYGGMGAKSVLLQLKQLSSQLKQAAGILKAGSEAAGGNPGVAYPGNAYADGRDAYATQQAAADAETQATTLPQGSAAAPLANGSEDDKTLDATFRALRALRALSERLVRQQEALNNRAP